MVVLTAAIAALGGLLFGYDTSVISGAMLFLRTDFHLTDVHQRKRNGFHPHNLSTQRPAGGLCKTKFVKPVL